jgi:preprotein translocase SecE subunit
MKTYREDQGRLARMFAFWSLVLMTLFGCTFLHGVLVDNIALFDRALIERPLPIVRVSLTWGFIVSLLVFVVGTVLIWRWQQRPKVADFLIDTESEMRKVTWPTTDDVVNTSMVVVVCVLILMGFLAFTDWFLGQVFQKLLLG